MQICGRSGSSRHLSCRMAKWHQGIGQRMRRLRRNQLYQSLSVFRHRVPNSFNVSSCFLVTIIKRFFGTNSMPSAVLGVGKRGKLPTILESRNPVFCRGCHSVLNDLLRLQLLPAEFLFLSAGGGGGGRGRWAGAETTLNNLSWIGIFKKKWPWNV